MKLLTLLLVASVGGVARASMEDDQEELKYLRRRTAELESRLQVNHEERRSSFFDPKSVDVKAAVSQYQTNEKVKRKFVSYHSSEWEQIWLNNVDSWANTKEICERLSTAHQMEYMHAFLNLTCTHRYEPPYENWCVIDDRLIGLWYNTANLDEYEFSWVNPLPESAKLQPGGPHPVVPGPEHERIVSKFVFLDETTGEEYVEYIEPLVSHLRFPLAHCVDGAPHEEKYRFHGTIFRGWVIPPPPTLRQKKKILFDAGASDWFNGAGGPSLNFFFEIWKQSGLEFDEIYAFEMTTKEESFYSTVPDQYKDRTHYQQCAVSSQPEDHSREHPFLPALIKEKAEDDDYVLFKLDIDSPMVENGNIDFILNEPDSHIDELVWEHHISGNYLMEEWGDPTQLDQVSLRGSYEYFLKMRQKGIRAHSWV